MLDDPLTVFVFVLLAAVVFAALFVALRALFIWYYKIDKRLQAAERTNFLLEKLLNFHGVDYEPSEEKETKE